MAPGMGDCSMHGARAARLAHRHPRGSIAAAMRPRPWRTPRPVGAPPDEPAPRPIGAPVVYAPAVGHPQGMLQLRPAAYGQLAPIGAIQSWQQLIGLALLAEIGQAQATAPAQQLADDEPAAKDDLRDGGPWHAAQQQDQPSAEAGTAGVEPTELPVPVDHDVAAESEEAKDEAEPAIRADDFIFFPPQAANL